MISLRPDNLRTVLCLGAHADDIEIGCGGALLHWLADAHAIDVHWVVFGAEGRREAEARQSAERFLRALATRRSSSRTGEIATFPTRERKSKSTSHNCAKRCRPTSFSRTAAKMRTRTTGCWLSSAWCAFRNHLILEYEIPKYEGDLGSPNTYVPLAESICRRKVELLMEGFPSQREKPWFTEDLFWGLMRLRGAECNAPSRFAEALYCRKLTLG